jgi:glycosyltransferase involved in cell wall biosynthesis
VIDWLLQSETACPKAYVTPWGGGNVWVGPTDLGDSRFHRIRKHVLGILHDLKLFSLMRTGRYDAIEVKDKFISGVTGLIAARLAGKRFLYWLSYPFPESYLLRARDGTARYPLLYWIRGWVFKILLYRILLPAADHVFVQSEQMRKDVAAEGVPLSKTTAVPMGIQVSRFEAPAPTERQIIPRGERCILYLGTLTRVRRLDFMVRVLAEVLKQAPDAKLYFVGGGDHPDDERVLIDEAERLGVRGSMVMVGQKPHAEALRYVQEADVCVSPFFPTPILNSTSPTKLVEYMALGKAVVANDHPEQRLVIEESGAGLCVPWDERAFADAIVKLLNAPEQRAEMGERGRRYAIQHRSYTVIADLVERTLLQAVPGKTARSAA